MTDENRFANLFADTVAEVKTKVETIQPEVAEVIDEVMQVAEEQLQSKLHVLGQELEAILNGRNIGDIELKDPYWDKLNELRKHYTETR